MDIEGGVMINRGDTILIKMPIKRNLGRLIQAYVYNVAVHPGEPRFLQTKAANGRKINLYENSPNLVCKVDASKDNLSPISHSQTSGDEK